MENKSKIHPRELEILNILWKSDKALTSTDIVEFGDRLSQSTVQAVLRKLLKDELLLVDGVVHSGNVLSRTYRPTLKSKKLILAQCVQNYMDIQHIVSKDEFIAALKNPNILNELQDLSIEEEHKEEKNA